MYRARTLVIATWLAVLTACGPGDETGASTGSDTAGETGTGTGDEDSGAPTTTVSVCVERCEDDVDCRVGEYDELYKCRGGVCELETGIWCTEDLECVIAFSSLGPCSVKADCSGGGEGCVDLGDGAGSCVFDAQIISCSAIDGIEVEYPAFTGGGSVTACMHSAGCSAVTGTCELRCTSDAECGKFVCDPATHRCECVSDDSCRDNVLTPTAVCQAGSCGCGTDDDCFIPGLPRCLPGGACGCGTDDDCTSESYPRCLPGGSCGCGTDDNCYENSSRCLSDGSCGCGSDDECKATSDGDICIDGLCACSASAACGAHHDDTKLACEPRP